MARTEIEHIVVPSLLDRLTDEAPKLTQDPPITRAESERRFRHSVERDVETLLNSRRTMFPAPVALPELRQSVYDFGLIDTTGIPVGTKAGRERILAGLRDAITRFEPRMQDLTVRLVDADQVRSPQMRFVIEATLIMDREREPVVFDTLLEVSNGEYEVHQGGGAPGA